jgi:hypothetical protein
MGQGEPGARSLPAPLATTRTTNALHTTTTTTITIGLSTRPVDTVDHPAAMGIPEAEYRARQRHLLRHSLPPRSLCLIPGHGITYSHDNIFHPFFQYPSLR